MEINTGVLRSVHCPVPGTCAQGTICTANIYGGWNIPRGRWEIRGLHPRPRRGTQLSPVCGSRRSGVVGLCPVHRRLSPRVFLLGGHLLDCHGNFAPRGHIFISRRSLKLTGLLLVRIL